MAAQDTHTSVGGAPHGTSEHTVTCVLQPSSADCATRGTHQARAARGLPGEGCSALWACARAQQQRAQPGLLRSWGSRARSVGVPASPDQRVPKLAQRCWRGVLDVVPDAHDEYGVRVLQQLRARAARTGGQQRRHITGGASSVSITAVGASATPSAAGPVALLPFGRAGGQSRRRGTRCAAPQSGTILVPSPPLAGPPRAASVLLRPHGAPSQRAPLSPPPHRRPAPRPASAVGRRAAAWPSAPPLRGARAARGGSTPPAARWRKRHRAAARRAAWAAPPPRRARLCWRPMVPATSVPATHTWAASTLQLLVRRRPPEQAAAACCAAARRRLRPLPLTRCGARSARPTPRGCWCRASRRCCRSAPRHARRAAPRRRTTTATRRMQ